MNPYFKLQPFDPKSRELNVVIDTPKGSRNKYSGDEKQELFSLAAFCPLAPFSRTISDSFQTRVTVMAIRSMSAL